MGPPATAFPDALSDGTTVLLCGFDPTEYALTLRCLERFGGDADEAAVVTMKRGVEATIETYSSLDVSPSHPSIGIVDMVSEGQSISATYEAVPTVFTPSEGDTERLVLALSELTGRSVGANDQHLAVRSLSPMLTAAATTRVTDVAERISGLRTTNGMALFGLNYTVHDRDTVQSVSNVADRVLWVSRQADGSFAMELRSTRTGHGQFTVGYPTDE